MTIPERLRWAVDTLAVDPADTGGGLFLFYEPPTAERAAELAGKLTTTLSGRGFATTTLTSTTQRSMPLLCVAGRPDDPTRSRPA